MSRDFEFRERVRGKSRREGVRLQIGEKRYTPSDADEVY